MTTIPADIIEALSAKAQDTDPKVILDNLTKWALDGDSPHAEAVLMAEAALLILSANDKLDGLRDTLTQYRDMVADSPQALWVGRMLAADLSEMLGETSPVPPGYISLTHDDGTYKTMDEIREEANRIKGES